VKLRLLPNSMDELGEGEMAMLSGTGLVTVATGLLPLHPPRLSNMLQARQPATTAKVTELRLPIDLPRPLDDLIILNRESHSVEAGLIFSNISL